MKLLEEGDCDLLFLCEVGAFREGLTQAKIHLPDVLTGVFGESMKYAEIDNCVAVWGFRPGGASQPVQVSLHEPAQRYRVLSGRQVDAAITRFDVERRGIGKWHVVVGNMHINY